MHHAAVGDVEEGQHARFGAVDEFALHAGEILPAAGARVHGGGYAVLEHVRVGMDGRQAVMRKGESRIAVAMHVDEAGGDIAAGNIQRFGGLVGQIGAHSENFAAVHSDVGLEGTLADGVDDRAAQKQIIRMLFHHIYLIKRGI